MSDKQPKPITSPVPGGGEFSTIRDGAMIHTVWFDRDGDVIDERRTVLGVYALHHKHIAEMLTQNQEA